MHRSLATPNIPISCPDFELDDWFFASDAEDFASKIANFDPFEGDSRAVHAPQSGAGLSISNKVNELKSPPPDGENEQKNAKTFYRAKRFCHALNPKTGVVFSTDTHKARLGRMQKRMYGYTSALHCASNGKQLFADEKKNKSKKEPKTYMATLSYRPGVEWKPHDIKRVTSWLKRRYADRLLSYAWVAELQARGAIHYHMLVTLSSGSLKFLDRSQKAKKHGREFVPWPFGSGNVKKAKSVHYLSKYIGKEHQKDYCRMPKGARCFGLYVSSSYAWELKNQIRQTAFPSWVVDFIPEEARKEKLDVKREEGGGWYVCGVVRKSDWIFLGVTDDPLTDEQLVEAALSAMDSGGPS